MPRLLHVTGLYSGRVSRDRGGDKLEEKEEIYDVGGINSWWLLRWLVSAMDMSVGVLGYVFLICGVQRPPPCPSVFARTRTMLFSSILPESKQDLFLKYLTK